MRLKVSYQPLWITLVKRNLNKTQLAQKAHLTTNHIANMGKCKHVSLQTLLKICEALDCKLNDVIEFVPDEKSHKQVFEKK